MNLVLLRARIEERPWLRRGLIVLWWIGGLLVVATLGTLGAWPPSAFGTPAAALLVASLVLHRTWLRDPTRTDDLRCGFCGKHRREVRQLIAGPGVTICNECVALSAEIIAAADQPRPAPVPGPTPPAPPPEENPFAPPEGG